MGTGKFTAWGNLAMDWHPFQGEEEMLLVTTCYRNWDKLWPDGPQGSTHTLPYITSYCCQLIDNVFADTRSRLSTAVKIQLLNSFLIIILFFTFYILTVLTRQHFNANIFNPLRSKVSLQVLWKKSCHD